MPVYLDAADRRETRATTNRVMAAVERFLGGLMDWMLGRQHDRDLRWSLGTLSSTRDGEWTGKQGTR